MIHLFHEWNEGQLCIDLDFTPKNETYDSPTIPIKYLTGLIKALQKYLDEYEKGQW